MSAPVSDQPALFAGLRVRWTARRFAGIQFGSNTMATPGPVRYFDTSVDTTCLLDSVFPILSALRPAWSQAELGHQVYSDGYINNMTSFFLKSDADRTDALVVRVYGCAGQVHPSRDQEFLTLQVAQAAGSFPPILAAFNNGIVYQHMAGRIMTFHDLTTPEVIKEVTRKLYRFQNMDVDSLELLNTKGQKCPYDKTPRSFEETIMMIEMIPESPEEASKVARFQELRNELTDAYLWQECEFIMKVLDEAQLPLRLCHGDLHPRNMIINDKTNNVTFIDYEMSGFSYGSSDLTRLTTSKPFYDGMGFTVPGEPDITPDIRILFHQGYLEAKHEHQGTSRTPATAEEMELLHVEDQITEAVMCVQLLVVGLAFVDIELDFDFLKMIPPAKEKYMLLKGKLPELTKRYRDLAAKV